MKKADYSKIASFYDKGRSIAERNITLWIEKVSQRLPDSRPIRLLDLGCGTGRFAIPLARELDIEVTGADASSEMLARAGSKDFDGSVKWDKQDAQALSYEDETFDLIFMSHLLHHVDSPDTVIAECVRVLRPDGRLILRYGAIEQIRDDVEHVFFPETLAIDESRKISVADVESWLSNVGFTEVCSNEIVQKTYDAPVERLESCRARGNSVMTMISDEAHKLGLANLAEYVKKSPDDPWLLTDKLTLTTARKPSER